MVCLKPDTAARVAIADCGNPLLPVVHSVYQPGFSTLTQDFLGFLTGDFSPQTVFNNVTVIARFDKSQPSKMLVQASIGALSSMVREFYVAEDYADLTKDASSVRPEPLISDNDVPVTL